MSKHFRTISPVDGSVVCEGVLGGAVEIDQALARAARARPTWRKTGLYERCALVRDFLETAVSDASAVALELAMQMGRPVSQGGGEVSGWLLRGRTMIDLARRALADIHLGEREGFTRFIRREPLGVVFVVAPWNYPWLTTVNALIPALVAGNPVVLKHSEQTPLVARRIAKAAKAVGLPEGVLQVLYLDHEGVATVIRDSRVAFVSFTGSVAGGSAIQDAASSRFITTSLERGGKDPPYVCADADVERSAASLVEGAFFNAGQSCCGIERIYVHRDVYGPFLEAFSAAAQELVLGDPRSVTTTLGPVVRARNAESIRAQIDAAVAAGARPLLDSKHFEREPLGPQYLAPQALLGVDHSMGLMREETFGPVVGLMAVADDDDAVRLTSSERTRSVSRSRPEPGT